MTREEYKAYVKVSLFRVQERSGTSFMVQGYSYTANKKSLQTALLEALFVNKRKRKQT